MPARPWFAFYPSDYLGDTLHLSLEQHGAYCKLMMAAYIRGGEIPKTMPEVAQILGVHTNKAKTLWGFLAPFWYETGGGYRHKRIDKELAKALDLSEKRAEAGRLGGLANAKQLLKQNGSIPQPHSIERKEKTSSKRKERATRLPEDWQLPETWRAWARANGNGLDLDHEAAQFRDHWVAKSGANATKVSWEATWRSWIRNALKWHGQPKRKPLGVQPGEQGSLYTKPIPGIDT